MRKKKRWETALWAPTWEKKPVGEEGAPGPGAVERSWWSRYYPEAHGGDHARADIHTVAHGGPHTRACGYSWRNCGPWRSHAGVGLLWRTAASGQDTRGAGEKSEKEGAAGRSCYGLTTTPHSHPLAPLGQRGDITVGIEGVKLSLGKRRGGEGVISVLPLLLTTQVYFNWQ